MKYSRTAIGLLTAQYRSVLKKCLLINLGLFALGAVSATPANAAPSTPAPTPNTITSWTSAQTNIDAFMDALHTWSVAESEVPDWDRQNGAITGWGMDQIFGALGGTDGVLAKTDDVIAKAIYFSVKKSAWYDGSTDAKTPDAVASGDDSVAVGLHAWATAESAAAFGDAANAGGLRSIAIGNSAGASQEGSIAIGARAKSTADSGMALGNDATATGVNAVALGHYANAAVVGVAIGDHANAVDGGIALGQNSAVATAHGVAIGTGASVSAAATNSVAIGQNSAATAANTFSVGATNNTRRIVNVTAGTDDTDAVNVAQMNTALNGKVNNTDLGFTIGTGEDEYASVNAYVNGQGFIKNDVNNLTNYTTTNDLKNGNKNLQIAAGNILATGDTQFVTAAEKTKIGDALTGVTLNGTAATVTDGVAALNALTGITVNGTAIANPTTVTVNDGTANGTILVNGAAVSVGGLGSAAFLSGEGAITSGNTGLLTGGTVYTALSDKSLNINAASLKVNGTNVLTAHQAVTLEGGTNNGTLKITTAGGTVDNVAVTGLGSAAFLDSDGAVASGNTDLVTGGTVYNAIGRGTLTIKRSLNGAAAEDVGTFNANATADKALTIADSDTTYTEGNGITIDSTAENAISVKAKTDGGITVNGDGVSVDTSVVQTKLTAANAGDGIAFATDESAGFKFSVDTASEGGLAFEEGKLKVVKAEDIVSTDDGFVTAAQVAGQNYLKNSATSKLALDTANEADLSVWNGSNILAGINISSGADTNAIQMIVNGSSSDKKAAIELNKDGAFYSKSGTMVPATDEIATLGTAANGAYDADSASYVNGTIGKALQGKQATLTAANAGAGLTFTADGQVLSVGATDSSITVGDDGIAVKHDGSLAVDATNGLGVNIADTTITKDETSGGIKVGTIAQSQVSGLGAALDAKAVITASGTDNVYTIADSKTGDSHVSKDFYDVTGTNAAIAASAATKANLAGGNQFTGDQAFGVLDGTTFRTKALIQGDGTAGFGMNDANNSYAFVVQKNAITANQSIAAKQGITFGNTTTYNIGADGSANLNAISAASLTATGNVQAAGLTFNGSDIATSITKATSEASATEVALATAGYAQEQAKAAADGVVSIDASDATKINFNTQSGTPAVEATTYTAGAIDTKLADKYNWSNITGATEAGSTPAETVNASTHVYSVDATDQAIANAFTTNTADAYAVSGKRSSALAAHIATYVEGNADKFATVQTTNNIITDLFNDKSLYIQGITGIPLTGSAADAYAASSQAMLHPATTLLNADEILAGEIVKKADDFDAGDGLAFVAASGSDPKTLNIDLLMSTGDSPANISGLKFDNGKLAIDKVAYSADAAENTYYDAATINSNFAKASDPGQTIVAQEVDTKALKVANPLDSATPILEAKYNTTTQKNEITMNGATSIDGGLSVEDGLTTDTLTLPDPDSTSTPAGTVTVKGIKTAVSDDGNDNYLITSGGVDAEFTKKVGTLTKNTGTADVPVYTTRSVADMIGVDANGELKFTEAAGVTNIASGDGSKSAPTTLVGAFENLSSALGKIHGLAENSAAGVKVNNTQSIFANGDINSAVTGVTTKVGSNLKVGTSVEELEVSLDNAIGNIQAGNTVVGKAYADQFGNLIDTTYAKDDEVVHLANPETITGVKTFTSVVNANAGVKIGNDWQMDENPTTKAFIIRDASTAGTPMVAMITKDSMALNSSAGNYFFVNDKGLSLNDTAGGLGTVFNASAVNGDIIASAGKFTVATDTADASKVKVSVAGDIEATGNVKAASLTLPNLDQTTAGATITAQAIDNNATAFTPATDGTTLATLASVNTLAEKAHYTNTTSGLTADTIGGAIDELQATKQAQLYYMDGSTKKPMNAEVKTTIAAAASAEDANLVTEKAIRTALDDITNGVTKFNKLKLANNAATSADVQMLLVDDGTYNDELATTFATNLSVKSAVNKLVFGGNPNIWTGVNEFQNTLKVTKNNGSSFDTLFMVDNTSGNTTIASLKLGDYATAMNGIDLMPTLDSYNHLVTSGGVYDALQGTGTTGETINFGSRADNIVIGTTAYNMTMNTKTGVTTIGDGNTTGNIQMNKGALTAGTSVKVGSDSANSLMNASGLTVKNGDDNVAITSNSITLTDSGTSVFNVDQYGSITAGQAADDAQFVLNTQNGTANINTAKNSTVKAAIAADGDSAAMEATDGTYDYLISANADMTTPANRGVVVGVTATGQDKLLAGFEADNDSVGMGIADSNGDLVAGFSADKAAADQNIIEMGAFDNTDPNNPKLDTGISVDSKGKTVSIAAAGNEVVNVSYDTTKGKGLVGVTGDLTATGNFSADNAGFTVSHNDSTGKTDVVATGDVKAASLTLPNLDQTTTGATITATAIDNNATAFPTSGAGTTLATLSSIQNLAAQGAYTPGDQNSWRNPYAGDASTKPTTIAGALDRLATNLDAATNSLGDWKTLDAYVHPGTGSPAYTGNITDTGSTPYEAPSAVSAIIDLDKSIGNRGLLVDSGVHYTNPDSETSLSVSQAIANMDTKVYEAIHGTGTPTAPDGKVFVGDAAKQIVIGNTKSDHKQYIRIDQESEKTLIGNTTFGETIDSINKVATIGGTNPNHYKMTLDGKNQKTTFGTPTNNITMEKGDLTATGDITATGELSAENGTFTVTNDGTKTTMALTGDAQINGDESVTGKITVQATGSNAKVEIDHAGTITATDGAEIAHYDAAGITLNNGTADTFTVDTTNGDMMAAAGNFAVTTADGSATSLMSLTGDAVISGDTKTTTFTMPDAYQPTASSVQYAQVTSIDKGTTAANSFSDAALATTQSIKTKAENADYTASDALKAGNYATAQTSVATINNAIESLDLRIGDWDGLNLTPNGNLTNGHAGDAGYNEPETVVEAFNNIDSTLGRIHGLVTDNGNGTYTYNKSSGAVTQDWTNLAVGTTVEEHVLAVDTAIGNRNGYTAAYNINRGESVAESLNNIDLRLGDVKSLNNMNYYGEQNPNDVNLTGAVRALDNNLYRVEHDLKTLRHETHAGLASAAALSALVPNPRGTGDTTLSFGTGAYQGHTAAALGGFHWITNNLLVNAGVGWDNREATTRIGVSYSF